MSVESAKGFLAKYKADEAFAKSVNEAKSVEEKKKVILGAGFDFTQAELNECRGGELSDADLDAVAGGSYVCTTDTHCSTN